VPVILICAPDPLTDELHDTLLWREGIERHVASSFVEALSKAVAVRPDLAVVDRDLPEARRLVEDLRTVGRFSIAIVARGDVEPDEVELLEAGPARSCASPPGRTTVSPVMTWAGRACAPPYPWSSRARAARPRGSSVDSST
jgi:DNA-binding NarL/FixJ family response regulator